jgi:signal transduction histidine kinase
VAVFAMGMVSYKIMEKAILQRTEAQLLSINILKNERIETYFRNHISNVRYIVSTPVLREMLGKQQVISDSLADSFLHFTCENYDFEFLVLTDSVLNPVISSRLSEKDFSSNLRNLIKREGRKDEITITDITSVLNGDSIVRLLTTAPVKSAEGKVLGILFIINTTENLTDIMYERAGMGKTGESYLVGNDLRMRSRSRFFPGLLPYSLFVKTISTEKAKGGKEGVEIIEDYRGVPVISAFRTLNVPGLNWFILSEIDLKEAFIPIYILQKAMIIIGITITLIFSFFTLYISQTISSPIVRLKNLLLDTSKGIIPDKIPVAESYDEIGMMVRATGQLIDGLRRTSEFAFEIGNGNFNESYTPLSSADVLGMSLIQMRDKLKILTEKEIMLIRQNSIKLLEGQEEERKRISRELHDGLGQLLTAIRFKIGDTEDENLKAELRKLLDETISETRRISNNLMPTVLMDFGLEAALKKLAGQIQETSKIRLSLLFEEDSGVAALPFEITTNVYRIIQEALNNVIKYSGATEAEVAVFHAPEKLTVEVADNGNGFVVDKVITGNGLKNMKERISMLKGRFKIQSVTGKGTVIFAEIPLSETILNSKI